MELLDQFRGVDTSEFPPFHSYQKPLEQGMWVLWVVKDSLGVKKLTAEQIVSVIRDVQEISVDARSITGAFNRAKGKVHTYREGNEASFEIMKPGKDHLLAQLKGGSVEVVYFEPGKRYTSKRVLSNNVFAGLGGELRIVDPYCGQRCLDVLADLGDRSIKFLTRLNNLTNKDSARFLRDLKDFKHEHASAEFRSYGGVDIHDRYILSFQHLVLLGHSIKDMGAKESFAIRLDKDTSADVYQTLKVNFDSRWAGSEPL